MEIVIQLLKHKRKTFIPVVNLQNTNYKNYISSKFGGKPFISNEFPWPLCECGCQKPMKFFLQLNSNQLVLGNENFFGDGLLQLFYCTNDDKYKPFSISHCVRIIKTSDLDEACAPISDSQVCAEEFESKIIIDWKEEFDYPSDREWSDLGLDEVESENIGRI